MKNNFANWMPKLEREKHKTLKRMNFKYWNFVAWIFHLV